MYPLAVETYSEYESIASESEEPSLDEVKKAGRKVKAIKKGHRKEKTLKNLREEPTAESYEKPRSGSEPKKEIPKEEGEKAASASMSKPLPKPLKSIPAVRNGQKTINSFFGKK